MSRGQADRYSVLSDLTPAVRLGALGDAVETVTATVECQLSEEKSDSRRIVHVAGYRPMLEWTWTGIVGRR